MYGPWCLNVACNERLLVQCWSERNGATLTVHTRFASLHKDGSECTTDSMVLDAACETPPLEAGEYTIRHGDKTYPLKIPSVVRSPCFDPKTGQPGSSCARPRRDRGVRPTAGSMFELILDGGWQPT